MSFPKWLAGSIAGDIAQDEETLKKFSRDTSIFEARPEAVIYPRDAADVAKVVRLVHHAKAHGEDVSLTARAAGTDMTGGPLTHSLILAFTRYMTRILAISDDSVQAEPGVYYRDLERATLEKSGKIIPSYPASREWCALGGMVANNSGGELTLRYGKTDAYVQSLSVVLSDGSTAILKPLTKTEREEKESHNSLEGTIYRAIRAMLEANASDIQGAKPSVSKNSAGYALWDVWDRDKDIFDLTKLVVGSQGTLAIITDATLRLVKIKNHRSMLIVFLDDVRHLPEVVKRVSAHNPESFESYDDHTFRLAVRFAPQILRHFGLTQMLKLAFSFVPEAWLVFSGRVPKLVLMAEFAEESADEALEKARAARASLSGMLLRTRIARSETQAAKYWTVRRESFSLLRKNLKGLYAAPFIDDLVVHPSDYAAFLPELDALLRNHRFVYTIAGHIGDGNFHIIPLEDMSDPLARAEILDLMPKVYALVGKYRGSITGEHNDGILRTPYLPLMYSEKMCALFSEVKQIFDPLNIFNPGKKTGGTIADIRSHMITHA